MEPILSYFPTKGFKKAELRFRHLLTQEKKRLETIADKRNGSAIDRENLTAELPQILSFSHAYHETFMEYLKHVLPQHEGKIYCNAECKNCCHHYPMTLAPFELISFYDHLRRSPALLETVEECLFRVRRYHHLLNESKEDDAEEDALHRYFAQGLACPFAASGGGCSFYEARPVSCRMYFSLTPPEYCVPEYLQTEKNKSFIVYLPDDIEELIEEISAYYSGLELPESFYEGLLAMNALEPCYSRPETENEK
ncbi:MAG: YkgJ family cysteine cluster protein [Fibrobacter sp.]|nr:YkgJ family cysteine cluster protein [Fibrobacter sp.]